MAVSANRILMQDYVKAPNYDALFEIIQIYLNRYDEATTDAIPFFINAAEKTILREVRMPSTEKIVSFTLDTYGNNDGWVPLPNDYVEMRYVWTDESTLMRVPFDQILRGVIPSNRAGSIQPVTNLTTDETYSQPCTGSDWSGPSYSSGVWAINADRMYIKGVDSSTRIYMTYYKDIPELGTDTQSNPLLELLPDAFLYYAVAEGWRFLMEYDKAEQWTRSADMRVAAVTKQVEQAEWAGSPLVIMPGG